MKDYDFELFWIFLILKHNALKVFSFYVRFHFSVRKLWDKFNKNEITEQTQNTYSFPFSSLKNKKKIITFKENWRRG